MTGLTAETGATVPTGTVLCEIKTDTERSTGLLSCHRAVFVGLFVVAPATSPALPAPRTMKKPLPVNLVDMSVAGLQRNPPFFEPAPLLAISDADAIRVVTAIGASGDARLHRDSSWDSSCRWHEPGDSAEARLCLERSLRSSGTVYETYSTESIPKPILRTYCGHLQRNGTTVIDSCTAFVSRSFQGQAAPRAASDTRCHCVAPNHRDRHRVRPGRGRGLPVDSPESPEDEPTMNMLRHPVQKMFLPLADPHLPISRALRPRAGVAQLQRSTRHRRVHREGCGNIVSREGVAHSQRWRG